MKKNGNGLFTLFLAAWIVGLNGSVSIGLSAIFMDSWQKQAAWIVTAALASGIASALFFSVTKWPGPVRTIASLAASGAAAFAARAAWIVYAQLALGDRPSLVATGVISGLLFLFSALPAAVAAGRHRFVRSLVSPDAPATDRIKYAEWAAEKLSGREFLTEPRWFGNLAGILLFILVVLAFAASLREPGVKWPLSAFLFVMVPGAAGLFLFFQQATTLLRWRMLGLPVPEGTEANWNRVIRLLLAPVILVPLIIPWNFRVFDVSRLADQFKQAMSGVTIDLSQGRDTASVTNAETGANSVSNTVITVKRDLPTVKDKRLEIAVRVAVAAAVLWAVWRLVAGIIGAVLFARHRYSRKTPLVDFFIRRYFQLRGFFEAVLGFLAILFRLTLGALGLGGKRNRQLKTSPVEKQLFAFFAHQDKASKEKQEEILTIVKQFVRIIEAGSRNVTPWYHWMGPKQYGDQLSEKLKGAAGAIRETVDVFNESRYSLHMLTVARKKSFVEAVERVLEAITEYAGEK